MSDASLVWAAYATGIAVLSGLAGLGSNQRFAIAPQNTFSIPVVPLANQFYQNFNVYRFASVVPVKDSAVLTSNGQTYDTAYGLYLDNVFIQVPNDPRIEASINATAAKLDGLRRGAADAKKAAVAAFIRDCPNGIDPFTGQATTLGEYAAIYYPEIKTDSDEIAKAEAVRKELVEENLGGPIVKRLNTWRDALTKGQDRDNSFTNYNMPVLQVDAPTVINVSNGTTQANNVASSYESSFTIGGQFNQVANHWIDTFPSDYPFNRTRYDAGRTVYSVSQLDTSKNNWSNFGYSSATATTGSDGWIFWSSSSTTTTTSSHNTVHIDEKSFSKGITVSAWGLGQFPIEYGQWYQGNPLRTFPVLVNSAPASVREDVKQQITSVIMGYGVETTFSLVDSAYQSVTSAISSAKSTKGSLSIFGSLYGSSDGSYSSTYNSWSDIETDDVRKTVILRAQNAKVPQVLGTIITTISD